MIDYGISGTGNLQLTIDIRELSSFGMMPIEWNSFLTPLAQ